MNKCDFLFLFFFSKSGIETAAMCLHALDQGQLTSTNSVPSQQMIFLQFTSFTLGSSSLRFLLRQRSVDPRAQYNISYPNLPSLPLIVYDLNRTCFTGVEN